MESKTSIFTSWFDTLNEVQKDGSVKRKVEISDTVSIGDRGLIAKEEISPNECIINLTVTDPRILLTPNRAIQLLDLCHCDVSAIEFSNKTTTIDPLDALTLFFYHLKTAESTFSKSCLIYRLWNPYLSVLPSKFSDVAFISHYSPLLFAPVIGLCPLSIKSACVTQSTRLRTSFSRILPNTDSHIPFEFYWAWSLVNSRCVFCKLDKDVDMDIGCLSTYFETNHHRNSRFRLSTNKNAFIAIVPFFDFFNHSPHVSSHLEISDRFLKLFTREAYFAGDQVFINYGPHDNLFLLCEYGFSILDNLNDAVYPTYGELRGIFPASIDSLNHVLKELQIYHLDRFETLATESTLEVTWKSIYLTASEPSYFLGLILFAMASAKTNSLTRDRLFSVDESECFSVIQPSLRTLLSFLRSRTSKSISKLSLNFAENDSPFMRSLICLLTSRFNILSNLINAISVP